MARKLIELVENQDTLTMPLDATVKDACTQMRDRRTGCVLVTDENSALVGIFTASDAVSVIAVDGKPDALLLQDVMTTDPVTIAPERSTIEALRLMWDCGIHHVPLTRAGAVIGVVARSDFSGDEYERLAAERQLWEHMR
jgi:CBS domain-containing protein